MEFSASDLGAILPELFVVAMACVILVLDLYLKPGQRGITYGATVLTLLVGALLAVNGLPEARETAFHGHFVHDSLSGVLKLVLLVMTALVVIYARRPLQRLEMYKGELFILVLLATTGMMLMASAGTLLMAYLGLELMSLSLYTMIAMDRDSVPATEGALKYFILGSLASGVFLYGLSLLYGASGSLLIADVASHAGEVGVDDPLMVMGVVFVAIGLAFKLGAVPFHMWVPDVYQGAPSPITALLASTPKLAAFALLLRVMVDGLGPMAAQWQEIAAILAVLSLVVGNVVAIAQSSLKRMLAYSAIAHVGYLLIGLAAAPTAATGYMPTMMYMVMYTLMGGAAFGLVTMMHRQGVAGERIEDYAGFSQSHPWKAFLMMILMFAMAGVPPTGGFMAKLYVFQAAVQADMVGLAVFGVLMAVIGAFYYLRVVKVMYFDAPGAELTPDRDGLATGALSLNALAVLLLGIVPAPLVELSLFAVRSL
ncbi:NADH:ubiquinone oxidoreductase subunit N [Thiohalorhabdus denitrificans]|uniref:NADH-quinone oxidoreductase subunit N n=1 Tax=Thiohalorhabdus denitrificans TaxID=381306 RepID=A0A0P9C988_9GAMM|nr:NADH-quinone oxidoreductase subunit NuoN [Thiohalorhabdus denitrificans]KPV41628.1 NADH:ubiquinone oxidoreductase subunit N [Thiohalorhabdus denitrificans]SCY56938.1 NADH dehydrogenase subunit N [Thiohalorhabdus denitrificans]